MKPRTGNFKGRKPGATKKNPETARTLFAAGWSITSIASELLLSERTVRRYIQNGTRS